MAQDSRVSWHQVMREWAPFLATVLVLGATVQCSKGSNAMAYDMGISGIGDRKYGWQQAARLTAGNSDKKLTMQANFPVAGYYTCQFSVTPVDANATINYWFQATVKWSVEGQIVTRKIDVTNGTSISGPGQAVSVVVENALTGVLTPTDYIVSVQVTPGTRPSINQPPTLQAERAPRTVANGASTLYFVPQNCGVISVMAVYTGLAGATVWPPRATVRHASTILLKSYDAAVFSGFVPLAPGASSVQFLNQNTPAEDLQVQVTWGIDG